MTVIVKEDISDAPFLTSPILFYSTSTVSPTIGTLDSIGVIPLNAGSGNNINFVGLTPFVFTPLLTPGNENYALTVVSSASTAPGTTIYDMKGWDATGNKTVYWSDSNFPPSTSPTSTSPAASGPITDAMIINTRTA